VKPILQNPRFRAWLGKLALWTLVLVGVVLVFDRLVMPAYTRQNDLQQLPRVVGLPIDQARAILDSLGFPVSVEHRVMDNGPRNRADDVLEQFPRGNLETKRGRTVHLTLAAGKSAFGMPELKGKSERQVLVLLGDLGLAPDSSALSWRFDDKPAGTVIRQNPRAGRSIQRGGTVGLVFSLGPTPEAVEVPSLLGLQLDQARMRLERSGLVLGPVEEEAVPDRPAGIRGQSPLAGARITPGDSVSVRLNHPERARAELPDSSLDKED
jgi:beta-lactam-binding protein with PASTA domain